MIPRKIHYCWLSGEDMPPGFKQCMTTWKKVMPDYELVRWDTARFDIESNAFVSEAFRAKKWAFAADYIRIHALHSEGGIYLDCDVAVRRPFDELLAYGVFTSLEYYPLLMRQQHTLRLLNPDGSSKEPFTRKPGIGLQAAVIAGVAGHPFLRNCLSYYQDRHFVLPDGTYFDTTIAPDIYAMVAETYGFRYKDEKQLLRENMLVLPSEIFAGSPDQVTSNSYAVHYCAGSWRRVSKLGICRRAAQRLYRISREIARRLSDGRAEQGH